MIKSIEKFKEKGKAVVLRVDYNVETSGGRVLDLTRIEASLKTIKHLLSLNSKIIIISHVGRPGGQHDPKLSLEPAAEALAEKLNRKLAVIKGDLKFPDYPMPHLFFLKKDLREQDVKNLRHIMTEGDIVVLENIRFYKAEEELSQKFGKLLAGLGDIYVNEAFAVAHHASTSVSVLPKFLPHYAGFTLLKELDVLGRISQHVKKPLVLVVGGAKITDKQKMLEKLLPKADRLITGGALATLFLKVKNYPIGDSLIQKEGFNTARDLIRNFKEKIVLPKDVVVGRSLESRGTVRKITNVGPGEKIYDLGPETILEYSKVIKTAATIIWNGPMGVCEHKQFSHGTKALARLIASRAKLKTFVVAGGGETIQALDETGLRDNVDFVSTGGGAMLDLLGGEKLPGVEALN